jgi:uncharacterized membrane protein
MKINGILAAWKVRKSEILILLLFAAIYSSVSLVNHYLYRTHALDLGMFNHAIHAISTGNNPHFTLTLDGKEPLYLADHFSPITYIYVPIYYVFGSWTLLLIQITSILFGAWGCYKVALLKLDMAKKPLFILVFFLSQWAVFSALSFDFHNNVIAAMLVPWLYLYFLKQQKLKFLLIIILLLLTKENTALWLVFILIGFMLEKGFAQFKNNFKNFLSWEIPILLFAIFYFIFIVSYVMPMLSNGDALNQISRYDHLGNSVSEIAYTLLVNPWETLNLLVESNSNDPVSFGIKMELHTIILLSGGIALLLRPAYLVMLIPIFAQKLFSSNMDLWGINGQYSIEFTPILTLAFIDLVRVLKNWKHLKLFIAISVMLIVLSTLRTFRVRKSAYYDRTNSDFTSIIHYKSGGLDIPFIQQELKKIPKDIPISVSSCFAPHLADRKKIYLFPVVKDAQFIVLIQDNSRSYPVSEENLMQQVDALILSGEYQKLTDENKIIILKKKTK